MPDLEVSDELQQAVWHGEPTSVQFDVNVPENLRPRQIIGTVTVSQDGVPIGQLKFKMKVLSAGEPTRSLAESTGEAIPFNLFFVSYATKDRSEVIMRLQMLKVTGKNFRQDLLDLEPGDRWERKLYEFIDECDAVLLFWSTNAKESEWVMRECKYAIEKKGIERIIPVIIEGPPPIVPPPELAQLHMNDRLMYFIR